MTTVADADIRVTLFGIVTGLDHDWTVADSAHIVEEVRKIHPGLEEERIFTLGAEENLTSSFAEVQAYRRLTATSQAVNWIRQFLSGKPPEDITPVILGNLFASIQNTHPEFSRTQFDAVVEQMVSEHGTDPPTETEGGEEEAHDHSGPHQAAVRVINNMLGNASDLSQFLRREIWDAARNQDPALTETEFNDLLTRAWKERKPTAGGIKERSGGGHRCFFRVSKTYRERYKDDPAFERHKIVLGELGHNYKLPADLSFRQTVFAEIRTKMRLANLPDATDEMLETDAACWRLAYLWYHATQPIAQMIYPMITLRVPPDPPNHPSALPLRDLLGDSYTTWESLGLGETKCIDPDAEAEALEWLKTLTTTKPNEGSSMKAKFVNLLQLSDSYNNSPRMQDDTKDAHAAIMNGLWREYMEGGEPSDLSTIREKTLEVKPALTANFSTELNKVRTVLGYYSKNPDFKRSAVEALETGAPSALLLKKLVEEGKRTLADFGITGGTAPSDEDANPPRGKGNDSAGRGTPAPRVTPPKPPSPAPPGTFLAQRLDLTQYEIPKGATGRPLRVITAKIEEALARIDQLMAKVRAEESILGELESDFATLHRAAQLAGKYNE